MVYFRQIPEQQELAFAFFTKALEKKQLARSYLLCGGAHSAKYQLILELNKILNCKLNKDPSLAFQPSCNECSNCRWIAEATHPKTPLILEGEGKKGNIKVEKIRELQSELAQSCDYFRIIIISDASKQGLNASSSAALLKTIEEAKPNTLFMLLAESRDTVLPTISSRSQSMNFAGNEEEPPNEIALELFADFERKLNSGELEGSLNQILAAEKLAENETSDLISMLELWQDKLGGEFLGSSPNEAMTISERILKVERTIADIKAFVRPKAALVGLLK